ncbi:MAG TPA: tryptophan--tRNA ligase [Candidatus Saccharimonadales bacterium]|nr:tryptophan--tRNA ligase [Candidatus Saccharimonadales bacterium]
MSGKDVILTGIRANNDLHIGNYFGALLPIVDMAKKHSQNYQINLFVPDLHSFTTPIDHSKLQQQIMHNLRLFVAAGLPLDNDSIHIYRQSYIPAHSELTWILDCFTGFGEMSRMTQFKDKSKITPETAWKSILEAREKLGDKYWEMDPADIINDISNRRQVTVGVFNYPVLMAADILLYGAKYVPVGDDQTQHLEFTRDIAGRMNQQFGDLFKMPEPVAKQHEFFGKDQGLRIRDLVDPTKKMSKSDESGRGIIFLGDTPEEATDKIMSATTDSFSDGIKLDITERPGVTNLVQIHDLLMPDDHDGVMSSTDYKQLKTRVASVVRDFLIDFHNRLNVVDDETILRKLEADETAMAQIAADTLLKVQKAVGLRP